MKTMTYQHKHLDIQLMAAKPGKGEEEGDLALAPAKPKLKRPPLYKVVLLNDDYTPMEFVVEVLEHFFSCLLYTSPSPRDQLTSRMPSSA